MNKMLFALLMLVSMAFASLTYTVDTDRAGFSSVTLALTNENSAEVPLPQDAQNFRIVGGTYEISNNTATISSGSSGITTFSFTSSTLTAKINSVWKLSFSPPQNSMVIVYMPAFAVIEQSDPQPIKVSSQDSRTSLEFDSSDAVEVMYGLEEIPEAEGSGIPDANILIIAIVLAAAAIIIALIPRQKLSSKPAEKKPTMQMTSGKKEMMETFNENDKKIVNCLLRQGGKSKRNDLERKTGISKSSLAMAINRLEKRKIIEIDRGSTTHFVKLSEYFLKL